MHILLIDDSSSTRSLLRTLVNSGQTVRHEISEAASGEEALQKVGSGEINLPDLIIVDINMAGMSGYDLCREFRMKHPTGSDIRPYIIVVTANEGVDVINEALDSGANDYMPKPVNAKILQVRLRVAERLLSHSPGAGGSGSTNISGSGRVILNPGATDGHPGRWRRKAVVRHHLRERRPLHDHAVFARSARGKIPRRP
jgi:CheY-like chemotaxis protein